MLQLACRWTEAGSVQLIKRVMHSLHSLYRFNSLQDCIVLHVSLSVSAKPCLEMHQLSAYNLYRPIIIQFADIRYRSIVNLHNRYQPIIGTADYQRICTLLMPLGSTPNACSQKTLMI